jgi:RHS repeat-associated protein
MTDANQTVVWSGYYKPFGAATITVSTITNNLRFPGQYFDAETGLSYNYMRDYNTTIGRYIESDPIGLTGGDVNVYRYVMNNPNSNVDPDGLLCKNKNSANPPMGAWTGTDIPTGAALAALVCIEKCTGGGSPWSLFPEDNGTSCSPYDLQISGGSECTTSGSHIPGSKTGSKHCTNQAFDIPNSVVSSIGKKKLMCCARSCGIKYIKDEGWLHFQTVPGQGGRSGILPSAKDCCSSN